MKQTERDDKHGKIRNRVRLGRGHFVQNLHKRQSSESLRRNRGYVKKLRLLASAGKRVLRKRQSGCCTDGHGGAEDRDEARMVYSERARHSDATHRGRQRPDAGNPRQRWGLRGRYIRNFLFFSETIRNFSLHKKENMV